MATIKIRNRGQTTRGPFIVKYTRPRTVGPAIGKRDPRSGAAEVKAKRQPDSISFGPGEVHEVDERDLVGGPLARALANPQDTLVRVK